MSTWQPPMFSASRFGGSQNRFAGLQMAEMQNFQHLFQQLQTYKERPRVFHSQPGRDQFVRAALALSNNN